MTRTDYYNKLNEVKKLVNEMETYADNEIMNYWHLSDDEFDFRKAQQFARLESAKTALHIIGTMLAFNTNI